MLDDLERQVAVAELELPDIETAHHVDSAKLVELEDLAGTIDEILAIAKADPGGQQTFADSSTCGRAWLRCWGGWCGYCASASAVG